MPCRAQIWWIRAVPNISVPCPHDPVPCQIFPCRALMIRAQIWWIRAKKYEALFCGKKRLRQRTHKSRASKNMGAPFLLEKKAPAATYPQARGFQKYGALFLPNKKSACGNVPTSQGLPEIWGPFSWEKKAPAATYPQVKGFQKFALLGIQTEKQGF